MKFFVLIFFMACVFFTWFFIHRAKVKERMLLIEKGVDLSNLPSIGKFEIRIPWLKIGIVVVFFSLGFLLGGFFDLYKNWSVDLPAVLACLFTGIGMIIAHYADRPKSKK